MSNALSTAVAPPQTYESFDDVVLPHWDARLSAGALADAE